MLSQNSVSPGALYSNAVYRLMCSQWWSVLLVAIIPGLMRNQSYITRFVDDIQTMLGSDHVCFVIPWKYFRWFWMFMWAIITPILCLV